MKNLVEVAKAYVNEVLGGITGGQPWAEASSLPFFLQDLYLFNRTEIMGKPCLLMICRSTGETPAIVRKHWKGVTEHYAGDVIYVVETISSFNRKRLIDQKVPFIVPGNQLYLPMLGLDLREHFKLAQNTEQKPLNAVAQVLLLNYILGRYERPLSAKELAEYLGYSAMTLTRAIKELVGKELATTEIVGRKKNLIFLLDSKELWRVARPYLQNPVKKRVWITQTVHAFPAHIAGESALAKMTMLTEPKQQIKAIYTNEWPGLKKLMRLEIQNEQDFDCIRLELWRYNPGLLTDDQTVDPLSLWLSLKDIKDERIDMALDEMINSVWSKKWQ